MKSVNVDMTMAIPTICREWMGIINGMRCKMRLLGCSRQQTLPDEVPGLAMKDVMVSRLRDDVEMKPIRLQSLEQDSGKGGVQPCWDASHIRRQPSHYRGAESRPRGTDQQSFYFVKGCCCEMITSTS